MKKLAVCVLAGCTIWQVCAAEEHWLTDLSKAQAQAKAEKKMVLVDFNGSDWCPPCKALRKNVLDSPEFLGYARTNLLLVDIDFPRHQEQPEALKKANQALAEKYAITGFPTVLVFSSSGKQLKKSVGYGGQSAKDFIAGLEQAKKQAR